MFYLDLLKQHYPSVIKLNRIQLEFKAPSVTAKKCPWDNCKKRSKNFCHNENCQKLVCRDHMLNLCCECFNKNPQDLLTFCDGIKNTSRICQIKTFCRVSSKLVCASRACGRFSCANHRHPICIDCASMKVLSKNHNYSVSIIPRKRVR